MAPLTLKNNLGVMSVRVQDYLLLFSFYLCVYIVAKKCRYLILCTHDAFMEKLSSCICVLKF